MKVIIHDWRDDTGILALRAVKVAVEDKKKVGALMYIEYENGAAFSVKRNKASFSVWPTQEPRQ